MGVLWPVVHEEDDWERLLRARRGSVHPAVGGCGTLAEKQQPETQSSGHVAAGFKHPPEQLSQAAGRLRAWAAQCAPSDGDAVERSRVQRHAPRGGVSLIGHD